MLSSIKRVLLALIIITAAAVTGLYLYTKDRTYYNNEGETGSTAGNIYNGGLFCQQDSTIYFNPVSEGGGLFSMNSLCENVKKLSDRPAVYINADKHYLYFVLANSTKENKKSSLMPFSNSGVYRLNQNGTGLMVLTGDPSSYLLLKGDYLYSQRYNVAEGVTLYQNKIDGEEERLLYKKSVIPADIHDDSIFFTDKSKKYSIAVTNLSSYTTHPFLDGSYQYPIFMGDYLYYINLDNHKLYRRNKDGSDPTLLVDKPCLTYNITNSGKYLYYQINGTKKDSIARLNLETMKSETIKKGDFKQIHVTDQYVFFTDSKEKHIYKILADGDTKASTFHFTLGPTPTPKAGSASPTPKAGVISPTP